MSVETSPSAATTATTISHECGPPSSTAGLCLCIDVPSQVPSQGPSLVLPLVLPQVPSRVMAVLLLLRALLPRFRMSALVVVESSPSVPMPSFAGTNTRTCTDDSSLGCSLQ